RAPEMYVFLDPESRKMRHGWNTVVLILLLSALHAMSGFSTGNGPTTADLVGSVADPPGAVVVDAGVTLLSLDRGAALTTATDQRGHYEFHDVLPGKYTLKVK